MKLRIFYMLYSDPQQGYDRKTDMSKTRWKKTPCHEDFEKATQLDKLWPKILSKHKARDFSDKQSNRTGTYCEFRSQTVFDETKDPPKFEAWKASEQFLSLTLRPKV